MTLSNKLYALCLLAVVFLVGCRLDAGGTDTGIDAGTDAGVSGERCILVTTTEFRSDGAIAVIDAETFGVRPDVTATHSDAHVRVTDERVLVLNRQGGDSIQELDRDGLGTISQRSVGQGTNPWGVSLAVDGTGWVALYEDGALQRVDVSVDSDDGFLVGPPILLPAHTEADQQAEPLDLFEHDGVLYVITQGLGDYPLCTPESRAHLLAFDPADATPVPVFEGRSTLELAACNTSGYSLEPDGTLWLAHTGGHRVTGAVLDDGGLERVHLSTGRSDGILIGEAGLQSRDVIRVVSGVGTVWLAVAADDFAASVVPFDVVTFEVGEAVWTSDMGGVFDLELAHGLLWVADRSVTSPGVVVVDPASREVVAGPLTTGFPPFDLAGFTGPGCGT